MENRLPRKQAVFSFCGAMRREKSILRAAGLRTPALRRMFRFFIRQRPAF